MNTLKKTLFVMETVATEDYIPYESDTKEVTDGKININSADTEQLVKLKGIGEKMSEKNYQIQTGKRPFYVNRGNNEGVGNK